MVDLQYRYVDGRYPPDMWFEMFPMMDKCAVDYWMDFHKKSNHIEIRSIPANQERPRVWEPINEDDA